MKRRGVFFFPLIFSWQWHHDDSEMLHVFALIKQISFDKKVEFFIQIKSSNNI